MSMFFLCGSKYAHPILLGVGHLQRDLLVRKSYLLQECMENVRVQGSGIYQFCAITYHFFPRCFIKSTLNDDMHCVQSLKQCDLIRNIESSLLELVFETLLIAYDWVLLPE